MTFGLSAGHNAKQMQDLTNSGTKLGNFMYVDTQFNDYNNRIAEALCESFDLALGRISAMKFRIEGKSKEIGTSNALN